MSLIEWKTEYSVGIPSVDREHRDLIALINTLHGNLGEGADGDEVIVALGEIFAQISAHFALEEKYMRDAAYPDYGPHKADHEKLLDDLRDIMDRVEDEGFHDEARLSNDLEQWFSVHFRTHDAKLHHFNV